MKTNNIMKVGDNMKRNLYRISNFICPDCGNVMPLPRSSGKQRKKKHIKDIYCPFCKEVKQFKEVPHKDSGVSKNKIIYS